MVQDFKEIRLEDVIGRFSYNSCNGVLTSLKTGKPVGHKNLGSRGYLVTDISPKLKKIRVHRICWLLFHGSLPLVEMDHIDTVRDHNWILNLRLADDFDNRWNQIAKRGPKKHLPVGVSFYGGKYVAQCQIGKRNYKIGRFDNPEDAGVAYRTFAEENRTKNFEAADLNHGGEK